MYIIHGLYGTSLEEADLMREAYKNVKIETKSTRVNSASKESKTKRPKLINMVNDEHESMTSMSNPMLNSVRAKDSMDKYKPQSNTKITFRHVFMANCMELREEALIITGNMPGTGRNFYLSSLRRY